MLNGCHSLSRQVTCSSLMESVLLTHPGTEQNFCLGIPEAGRDVSEILVSTMSGLFRPQKRNRLSSIGEIIIFRNSCSLESSLENNFFDFGVMCPPRLLALPARWRNGTTAAAAAAVGGDDGFLFGNEKNGQGRSLLMVLRKKRKIENRNTGLLSKEKKREKGKVFKREIIEMN